MRTLDGSFENGDGEVLQFSVPRFISDVVLGNKCFVCGRAPEVVAFDDEHVIPDWLLREHGLDGKNVTLPNGTTLRYDRYKVPCCTDCNGWLGENLEKRLSEAIRGGHAAVAAMHGRDEVWLLFTWMALLFLKTHLKDQRLRLHQDRRKGDGTIGDLYDPEALHHVHCLVRAPFVDATVDRRVLGTLLLLPMRPPSPIVDRFDFVDAYWERTILVRSGDVGLIAVLNDSGIVGAALRDLVADIDEPLTFLQLRELAARAAYLNTLIPERPVYFSEVSEGKGVSLRVRLPEGGISTWEPRSYGQFLDFFCGQALGRLPGVRDVDETRRHMREGRWSFLLDSRGNFAPRESDFSPG